MTADRVAEIERRLTAAFTPDELQIKDQSHLHAGHAGAQDGRGHFHVRIVSNAFEGATRVQIHQKIYAALGSLMETDIHALAIAASSPSAAQS